MSGKLLLQSAIAGHVLSSRQCRCLRSGRQLIIVATDRISAFDWVLPTGIPDKGRVLTALTLFWLERLSTPHHLIDTNIESWPAEFVARQADLAGRSMRVRNTTVVPIECVVRGYLAGSAWTEYSKTGRVCGILLPDGLLESQQLSEPIFTPATKEKSGHDINISFDEMAQRIGKPLAEQLRERSMSRDNEHARYASEHGIRSPTPSSRGTSTGELILIDGCSRRTARVSGRRGLSTGPDAPSFDKQFVRTGCYPAAGTEQPPRPAGRCVERRAEVCRSLYALTGRPLRQFDGESRGDSGYETVDQTEVAQPVPPAFSTQRRGRRWIFASRRPSPTSSRKRACRGHRSRGGRGEPAQSARRHQEFRVTLQAYEFTFPAGLVEAGEPTETAIRREPKEETGLDLVSIDSISPLTYSSSGLSDETAAVAFVKARHLLGGKPDLQDSEIIEVQELDFAQVCALCETREPVNGRSWFILNMYRRLGAIS